MWRHFVNSKVYINRMVIQSGSKFLVCARLCDEVHFVTFSGFNIY